MDIEKLDNETAVALDKLLSLGTNYRHVEADNLIIDLLLKLGFEKTYNKFKVMAEDFWYE